MNMTAEQLEKLDWLLARVADRSIDDETHIWFWNRLNLRREKSLTEEERETLDSQHHYYST